MISRFGGHTAPFSQVFTILQRFFNIIALYAVYRSALLGNITWLLFIPHNFLSP